MSSLDDVLAGSAASRASRNVQDKARKHDGTALSMEERLRQFRNEFTHEVLPKAPDIIGFHTCWLSTTNSADPIARRIRMGYEPVTLDDVPGFQSLKVHNAQFGDVVQCNEMVLFKIPLELYQAVMSQMHHDDPAAQERGIVEGVQSLRQGDMIQGEVEGDGYSSYAARKKPTFK